jgi:hypothetical protein
LWDRFAFLLLFTNDIIKQFLNVAPSVCWINPVDPQDEFSGVIIPFLRRAEQSSYEPSELFVCEFWRFIFSHTVFIPSVAAIVAGRAFFGLNTVYEVQIEHIVPVWPNSVLAEGLNAMNEPAPEQTKKDYTLLDEFVRQIATQAALLAGFTFTILTATSLEGAPYRRAIAFVFCATLTIALELILHSS